MRVSLIWIAECPNDYCSDCEDHAILREALMRHFGVSKDCAYCADHYDNYLGGGHTFNIVLYRNKWRIMDYGPLGSGFLTKKGMHEPHNIWNDKYSGIYCPDWRDGDGHWDCGCDKISPKKNYEGGDQCPSGEVELEDVPSGVLTYRSDVYL
jgi:hypothetical protein